MAKTSSAPTLVAAVAAAITASLCCIGPLVFLTIGISGAWISSLTKLEPLRPFGIALTLVFLGLAFYKLYLRPPACDSNMACGRPRLTSKH